MFLEQITGWHWLALGIVLLVFEVLGVGGILIGVGAAAILVALICAVVSISWHWQFVIFGVASVVATFVFWKFFRVSQIENDTGKLNNRAAQMVGTKVSVLVDIKSGRGKVQIQDALWNVSCEQDLPAGKLVEVVGYSESTLHVKPV